MIEPAFQTKGFELFDWQRAAVERWTHGASPFRGTLEIFTGGGKSLVALACAAEAAKRVAESQGDFRLLIVVPTKALSEQWIETIANYTTLPRTNIGAVSTRDAATVFEMFVAAVVVINTAAKLARSGELRLSDDTMLIVDECHRAGAPSFKNAMDLGKTFRLGLSATPEREELGDDGEPLLFDEQIVAKKLGRVVYSFGLGDARSAGRLPDYEIHHHGITLLPDERKKYNDQSGEVDDLSRRLRATGVDSGRARAVLNKGGAAAELARAYLVKTAMRKDLLYRASERERIALVLVEQAMNDDRARILLFNERIDAVQSLEERLRSLYGDTVEAEHSQLPAKQRRKALDRFRSGDARILISAKSLIEGIDVPDATVGISVASTASVRQRVQALGRVLRKGAEGKRATMHLIYVSETVDESIYEKEDWSDLTGESRNLYFRWSNDGAEPIRRDEPPKKPRPTEDQMDETLRLSGVTFPTVWPGAISGQEYSVDTRGNVKNAFGLPIANTQGVGDMLLACRGTPGGRFRVTPKHRFVLVFCRRDDTFEWKVAGRLTEAFESRDALPVLPRAERNDVPGETYRGALNKKHGELRLRSRMAGIIEKRQNDGVVIAHVGALASDTQRENVEKLLGNWRRLSLQSLRFYINDEWDAWFERDGTPIS
ncbi:MAG: DEAD/DEAH box helicase [Candidatus Eremiobacteraeota bacterium]|nr:DEAD/DEAH box helicase [Candidatus Eremiobacteraeota bacterium]